MHPAAAAACSPPLACNVVLCSTLAVTGARLLALQGKNGEEEVAVLSWSRPGRGRRDDDDAGHWRQRADDVEMADAKIGRSECASFGETGELDALPCLPCARTSQTSFRSSSTVSIPPSQPVEFLRVAPGPERRSRHRVKESSRLCGDREARPSSRQQQHSIVWTRSSIGT
jgi:hypothetical protein